MPSPSSRPRIPLASDAASDAAGALGHLAEAVADGVLLLGPAGTIVAANATAARLLRTAADELVGRTLHGIDGSWRASADGAAIAPGGHPGDVALRTRQARGPVALGLELADGERLHLSVRALPVPDGALVAFTDVTRVTWLEREHAALQRIAVAVAAEHSSRSVFRIVAEQTARALDAEVATVTRFDHAVRVGTRVGSSARGGARGAGTLVAFEGPTATGTVARTGEAARCEVAGLGDGDRSATGIAAPVVFEGRTWGAIAAIAAEPGHLRAGAEETLARFAELVGLAIARAATSERLRHLAATDHLTGLANQRAFTEHLEQAAARAERHGRPLSVVVLDLDHFKVVNDSLGHPAGDAVLAEVGERLRSVARQEELVARVGGEEFAWILPDADVEAAAAAAERARAAIAAEPFAGAGHLTASAGVCTLADAGGPGDLYRLADVALYWAKRTGRDRTHRYEAGGELVPPAEQERRLERAMALSAISSLARAIDLKDPSTHEHSARVAQLARSFALASGWAPDAAQALYEAGLVHDVGKIGIPDAILLDTDRLAPAAREVMRTHATLGGQIVTDALGPEQTAWVRHHHERWDGSGYPDGLAGEAIPAGARLLGLADAWDAMTSARPYAAGRSAEDAVAELRRCAGSQFAPADVAVLEHLLAPRR